MVFLHTAKKDILTIAKLDKVKTLNHVDMKRKYDQSTEASLDCKRQVQWNLR